MRTVLIASAACLALATPAFGQTTTHFANFSALDAAPFAHTPEGMRSEPQFGAPAPFVPDGRTTVATFMPFTQSYASRTFLQNLQDIRRYGGRLSVPFTFIDQKFMLEGEAARDYGPTSKTLELGRLRLLTTLGKSVDVGLEGGLYRGNPPWLRFAPHRDSELVGGITIRSRF